MTYITTAPVVLILASGRGERFITSGGMTHKLDAMLGDKTVLQHTLDNVIASGLAYHLERNPHVGMGDSLKASVVAASKTYPAAKGYLVLPADMPLVRPELLRMVADALIGMQAPIVYPEYQGARGHPVGFDRSCEADLLQLSGDQGARRIFDKHKTKKIDVDGHPHGCGCRIDIDTLEDLAAAALILPRLA